MNTFANAVTTVPKEVLTTNGMTTFDSSMNALTDLFFIISSSRGKDVTPKFEAAYQTDATLAMRMMFWTRDIRGGAGERDTFRKLLVYMEKYHPDTLKPLLSFVAEYGRWDDLLVFNTADFKNASYELITHALASGNQLTAKWLPRKGPIANELRKYLNYTPKQYRQLLVGLTKVVETQLCAKDWSSINYEHVPSVAASRYQKTFNKHDTDRYSKYREDLKTGTKKINASSIYPYDIVKSIRSGMADVASAQWDALPNYLGEDCIIPVVDVSGSMSCPVGSNANLTCMDVAISLGLYIADKQTGPFKDLFLNFHTNSKIHKLTGDLAAKVNQLQRSEWGGSTSIESAFREILRVATAGNVSANEMPKYLLVLSDMEFNFAVQNGQSVGAFDLAKSMYAAAGYSLPAIVFWNLHARQDGGNNPVKFDQNGTALVSGFSPSIMKSILSSTKFSPYDIMLETLNSDRYSQITV